MRTILNYIRQSPESSSTEIADACNLNFTSVQNALAIMRDRGVTYSICSGRKHLIQGYQQTRGCNDWSATPTKELIDKWWYQNITPEWITEQIAKYRAKEVSL